MCSDFPARDFPRRGDDHDRSVQPTPGRQVLFRPLDRQQSRPRPVRRRRASARFRRSTPPRSLARSARGASTSTTTTSFRSTPRRPSATGSSATSSARASSTTWSCRWRPSTCSTTRSSATAPSPPTTRACAPTPCRRRCGRWTWAPSWARRRSCSGADAREPRRMPAAGRTRRSSACARRSNYLCEYSIDRKYGYRFALEAKPNEPRGDIYMATTGAYLGLHRHARAPRAGRREPGGRARDRWPD